MGIIEDEVTIIITVKNEVKNLPTLMQSLLENDVSANIIVVDSESDDGTENFMTDLSSRNQNIRYIRKKCSRGQGRNIGVNKSISKYVLFTDGDAVPNKNWIGNMVSVLRNHDLVVGSTLSYEGSGTSTLPRIALYFKNFEITLPSMNLGMKRDLFMKLGGFDESFVTAEDIDLNLRAIISGATWVICNNCIVRHRSREGTSGLLKQAFWNGYGRRQLMNKNRKIWNDVYMGKITRKEITFPWIIRNIGGLMGYIYCFIRKIDFTS
ncbi:glycosyltransferase [mine drainage metagenome]|uniref:Glycosyltransferase n=1 Tax=mine drainage metagenome TaxID=410659 RepID=T1D232_9ZZZZ